MIPFDKLQVGTLIVPTKNSNSHSYIIGHTYRIRHIEASTRTFSAESTDGTFCGNILQADDCILSKETRRCMEDELKRLRDISEDTIGEINYLAKRIRWMDSFGLDEFDEKEYKMHTIIENTIGQEFSVSKNKTVEMANRIKCELAPFAYGDTVIAGKRKMFIIYHNQTSNMAKLSDKEGVISYKHRLLESARIVLIEKVNPVLQIVPTIPAPIYNEVMIDDRPRAYSGTTSVHQIFNAFVR